MPRKRPIVATPTEAAMAFMQRQGGVAIRFAGQAGSGRSTALRMIANFLGEQDWQIDIMDDLNHELLVRMPKPEDKTPL